MEADTEDQRMDWDDTAHGVDDTATTDEQRQLDSMGQKAENYLDDKENQTDNMIKTDKKVTSYIGGKSDDPKKTDVNSELMDDDTNKSEAVELKEIQLGQILDDGKQKDNPTQDSGNIGNITKSGCGPITEMDHDGLQRSTPQTEETIQSAKKSCNQEIKPAVDLPTTEVNKNDSDNKTACVTPEQGNMDTDENNGKECRNRSAEDSTEVQTRKEGTMAENTSMHNQTVKIPSEETEPHTDDTTTEVNEMKMDTKESEETFQSNDASQADAGKEKVENCDTKAENSKGEDHGMSHSTSGDKKPENANEADRKHEGQETTEADKENEAKQDLITKYAEICDDKVKGEKEATEAEDDKGMEKDTATNSKEPLGHESKETMEVDENILRPDEEKPPEAKDTTGDISTANSQDKMQGVEGKVVGDEENQEEPTERMTEMGQEEDKGCNIVQANERKENMEATDTEVNEGKADRENAEKANDEKADKGEVMKGGECVENADMDEATIALENNGKMDEDEAIKPQEIVEETRKIENYGKGDEPMTANEAKVKAEQETKKPDKIEVNTEATESNNMDESSQIADNKETATEDQEHAERDVNTKAEKTNQPIEDTVPDVTKTNKDISTTDQEPSTGKEEITGKSKQDSIPQDDDDVIVMGEERRKEDCAEIRPRPGPEDDTKKESQEIKLIDLTMDADQNDERPGNMDESIVLSSKDDETLKKGDKERIESEKEQSSHVNTEGEKSILSEYAQMPDDSKMESEITHQDGEKDVASRPIASLAQTAKTSKLEDSEQEKENTSEDDRKEAVTGEGEDKKRKRRNSDFSDLEEKKVRLEDGAEAQSRATNTGMPMGLREAQDKWPDCKERIKQQAAEAGINLPKLEMFLRENMPQTYECYKEEVTALMSTHPM